MIPPAPFGPPPNIGTEIIYSFVIIISSLMIYFGTKELYEISSYKGIKYFRQAFLFFASAYFFRSFIKFILFSFNIREIFEFSPRFLGPLSMFAFIYLSTMAIFYLLYSIIWKSLNKKSIYLFHLLAFLLSILSTLFRSRLFLLGLSILLFLFIILLVYFAYKHPGNKRKPANLYITYILLFIFWILNMIDILLPRFLQAFQLGIYLISTGIFLFILYKTLKKSGPR